MPLTNPEQSRVNKKCQKACERCRTMKVKCSGTSPCTRCARKKEPCHFAEEEVRVAVRESYLRELEHHYSTNTAVGYTEPLHGPLPVDVQEPPPNPDLSTIALQPIQTADEEYTHGSLQHDYPLQALSEPVPHNETPRIDVRSGQDDSPSTFSQNPLVENEYSFAKAPDGRFWYMGPSSSWSFCRRVLALLGRYVSDANCPPDPWNLDGAAFTLKWRPLGTDEIPDVSNLPPVDYGLYLFNTVKFYFGTLFYIIDEPEFIRSLHEFYISPATKVASMRLWYAQYLLILAFGKAFVVQNREQKAPAGYQYAMRAIPLMPDLSGMHTDPLQCIQALALTAVYFQSIDMRVAAFQHIGLALRFCIIEGMHRHMPEEVVGAEHSRRCKTIFWVVYMLDSEFAAQIGAPSSIRDEDITVRLFSNHILDESNITLHVRLARLNARILTTVYGVGNELDGTLIKNTQSIFRSLAELLQDLEIFLNTHFQGSVSRASQKAIRLILAYHHCVVLTTRPLVMCALHNHIERSEPQKSQTILLSPAVASLLQCCVDSAQTVLQTLRTLADEDLINFLPFQIEDGFASAFLLYLIRAIAPSLIPDDYWCDNIDFVLERMISKGNLSAPLRRAELDNLKLMMGPITPRGAEYPDMPVDMDQDRTGRDRVGDRSHGHVGDELDWDVFGADSIVGLEPTELLNLADQLDMVMHFVPS